MTPEQYRAQLHMAAEARRDDARHDADLALSLRLAQARARFDAEVDRLFAEHRRATLAAGQQCNAEQARIEATFRVRAEHRSAA